MTSPGKLIDAYLQGAVDLRAVTAGMTREQQIARPIAGRWSTLEVLCHLADFEAVMAERMKRIIALPHALLLAADENDFLKELRYHDRDAEDELALIVATRKQMSHILRGLALERFQRTGVHSVKGLVTLEAAVQGAINHVNHHLPFVHEKRKALGLSPV
ncbi:MAG TPA: DinB family protein [Urbifossiella sp.]|nr:DinB family protein [Urbifossiella sp.]